MTTASAQTNPEQLTRAQGTAMIGSTFFETPGFRAPPPGTYATYRRMSKHPTLALARATLFGPIMCAEWLYTAAPGANEATGAKMVDAVKAVIEPMRTLLVTEGLRMVEHGWKPWEKVWESSTGGGLTLSAMKPLLPDFTEIRVDAFGAFVGLRQDQVELMPDKCALFTFDGEAGNLYGQSRHENVRDVWSKWMQTDERGAQLATKAAAIIPLVHYPQGSGTDPNNSTKSNFETACSILGSLATGKGVALPNMIGAIEDMTRAPELAGKSQWVISFLEAAGAASNLAGMTDRQKYYDSLMLRGWLVGERAAVEATTAGSRADSGNAVDMAMLQAKLIHRHLCDLVTKQIVDDVLEFEFDESARGMVTVEPAENDEDQDSVFREIFTAVLGNTGTMEELLTQIDFNAVADGLRLPRVNKQPITFEMPRQPEPSDTVPGGIADKITADYAGGK